MLENRQRALRSGRPCQTYWTPSDFIPTTTQALTHGVPQRLHPYTHTHTGCHLGFIPRGRRSSPHLPDSHTGVGSRPAPVPICQSSSEPFSANILVMTLTPLRGYGTSASISWSDREEFLPIQSTGTVGTKLKVSNNTI